MEETQRRSDLEVVATAMERLFQWPSGSVMMQDQGMGKIVLDLDQASEMALALISLGADVAGIPR